MKEFNLQDALAGKPVTTRDGRPVKIAGYNEEAEACHVIGWVLTNYQWRICNWYASGSYHQQSENALDLFMAPEKREVWVCYYRKDGLQGVSLGNSKDAAEIIPYADKSIIITTVKIWEEEI